MQANQLLAEMQFEVNGREAFLGPFVASGSNFSPWCGQELGRFGARGALGCCGIWNGARGECSGALCQRSEEPEN